MINIFLFSYIIEFTILMNFSPILFLEYFGYLFKVILYNTVINELVMVVLDLFSTTKPIVFHGVSPGLKKKYSILLNIL